jgi:putative SOS response-associated peptidase YedK
MALFNDAFTKRRYLIPADGFYEWQKLDAKNKKAFADRTCGRSDVRFRWAAGTVARP